MPDFPSRTDDDASLVAAFLAATDHMSMEQFERETGLSWMTRARYDSGNWKRIYPTTRKQLRDYLSQVGDRGGAPVGEPSQAETREIADSPYLPNVSFLHQGARTYYESRLGSYLQRGWPMSSIERAAVELVASIVGAITFRAGGAGKAELTDDEQVMVLQGVARRIEEEYGANGTLRRT